MAIVLVTGAGGATGIGAIQSLAAETNHETVGVDMDPTAAGLHLADHGATVPAAADDDWATSVTDVVARHDVDVIVPTVDEELAVLPSLSRVLDGQTTVVAPRQPTIDATLDKFNTYRRLDDAGHEVPQTWRGTDAESIGSAAYPLLVKPRSGRGSRGVTRLEVGDNLEAHLDRSPYAREELLVQEFVDGTEFTTSVVATKDGRLLGVVPKEAIEKEGSTVLGATRDAPTVAASCRHIAETLDPAGPVNVQQIRTPDGTPYTIEINPRFSSTSCLTVASGVDEFDLLIRDALGESVDPITEYQADRYINRYQGHIFVNADDLDALD